MMLVQYLSFLYNGKKNNCGCNNFISEKLLKYFGYFEVVNPEPGNEIVTETVSGKKIEKAEFIPGRLTPSTDFEEMLVIVGAKKKKPSNPPTID